jgi:hypothetical protein
MDLTLTLYQTLIASSAMLIIALVVLLIYTKSPSVKSDKPEGDKNEPYLGGEKQPYDEESIDSGNLFWSIINQSLRKVYQTVVNRFHTYSIEGWLSYMSVWLAFLIILLVVMVVVL